MGISGLCVVFDQDDDGIRAALRRLAEQGMVHLDDHGEPTVLSPDDSVGRLLDERLRKLVAEQQEVLSFGYSLIRQSLLRRPPGHIRADDKDDKDVCERAEELSLHARREVLTMQPDRLLTPQAILATRRVGVACLRRGVTVKALIHRRALEDEATATLFTDLIRHGAQVRLLDGEFKRVLIADRATALVRSSERDTPQNNTPSSTPPSTAPTSPNTPAPPSPVLVEQGALVGTLLSFFERCWSQALDAAPLLLSEHDPLDALHLKVLQAMARADKDEVGARELGISVRTYRGRVAELLRHLQAATRFQAALRAKELGLI
ncbi:response regulator transcription factor [Streptomyces roseirectus]|uniref:Response regulator transcription factor n=1 Tax=Streptomyces roseirectus TaxID=2768066 RepID=A0A7H0IIP9_9ACTN|nr:response regulator transcription factor [Streptomyces roseirectus]QNP72665.1 response regulator transcription factor [Streptomyces roseirectus]